MTPKSWTAMKLRYHRSQEGESDGTPASVHRRVQRLRGAGAVVGGQEPCRALSCTSDRLIGAGRSDTVQTSRSSVHASCASGVQWGDKAHAPCAPPRTTHRDHAYPRDPHWVQGVTGVRPNHVWGGDIPYARWREEVVYLAVWMAVDTRGIRGWPLSRHLDQRLTWTAWRRAVVQPRPARHHADQGGQYAARAYAQT